VVGGVVWGGKMNTGKHGFYHLCNSWVTIRIRGRGHYMGGGEGKEETPKKGTGVFRKLIFLSN